MTDETTKVQASHWGLTLDEVVARLEAMISDPEISPVYSGVFFAAIGHLKASSLCHECASLRTAIEALPRYQVVSAVNCCMYPQHDGYYLKRDDVLAALAAGETKGAMNGAADGQAD